MVGPIVFVPPFELLDETNPAHPATASAATTALNWIRKIGRRTTTTPKVEVSGWARFEAAVSGKRTGLSRNARAIHTLFLVLSLNVGEGSYTWTEGQFSAGESDGSSLDPQYELANWPKMVPHCRKSS